MIYLWDIKSGPLAGIFNPVTQAQQEAGPTRAPLWIWLVGGLIVVAIGVMWTLYEENEARKRKGYLGAGSGPMKTDGSASARLAASGPTFAPTPAASQALPAETEISKTVESEVPPPEPDDLEVIVGIGPKIARILNERGIFTFEQLANTEVSFLEKLMEEKGWRMADPSTWPAQAQALAEQKRGKGV